VRVGVLVTLALFATTAGCMAEDAPRNGLIAAPGPSGIELLEEDGTFVRVLPGTKDADAVAWSPDGDRIAFSADFALYTIRRDGTGRRRVATNAATPTWSRDGEQLAFMRDVCEQSDRYVDCTLELTNPHDLFIIDVDGGDVRRLTSDPDYDGSPQWSPDGEWIAFECGGFGLCLIRPDGTDRRRLGGLLAGAAWTPDGDKVIAAGQDLVEIDRETGARRLVARRPGMDFAPTVSPDGERIAFLANSNCLRTGECTAHEPWEVWVIDVDGSNARRITEGGYRPPAWGPG
jgi:Tol biopolymer transport system component